MSGSPVENYVLNVKREHPSWAYHNAGDQKSSMGAAWPETEASRASLVTNGAPSFSASTM